jgi:hypothetical protein
LISFLLRLVGFLIGFLISRLLLGGVLRSRLHRLILGDGTGGDEAS